MISCFYALTMFLAAHAVDPNQKAGWFLGDGETWAYTWYVKSETYTDIANIERERKLGVTYFAINHVADDSGVKLPEVEKCKLPNGKVVPVLRKYFRFK